LSNNSDDDSVKPEVADASPSTKSDTDTGASKLKKILDDFFTQVESEGALRA